MFYIGGYPGAHGAGMGGMGGMGGLGNLGSLFQDPELLQAFQVYINTYLIYMCYFDNSYVCCGPIFRIFSCYILKKLFGCTHYKDSTSS